MNDISTTHLTSGAASPFLPGTKIQFAWDSTSIGWFKTCPRLYQYSMIEGWAPKGESVHLRFGIEFHSALEAYEHSRANGIRHEDAIHDTIRAVIERTAGWEVDRDTKAGKYKNRDSLISLVVDYLDYFVDDPCETYIRADGVPAVELSFRFDLDWGPQTLTADMMKPMRIADYGVKPPEKDYEFPIQPYVLCGHLDRVVEFNGHLFAMDHKDQPLTTNVLGPDGWVQIGNLSLGDLIAGRNGEFYPITGIFPKGVSRVLKVTFNDRTSVLCGEGHLWEVVSNINELPRVLTTTQMLLAPYYEKFAIPLCEPIQHPEASLPLDPYVLGCLLGDGYFGGNSIQLSSQDREIPRKVAERLRGDVIKESAHPDSINWTISGGRTLKAIKELGLWKCLSRTKFIPDIYLFGSIAQRWDLLNGLMDTDGSLNGHAGNGWRYKSMSLDLIEGVCELVRSLGGTARYSCGANGCYQATLRLKEWGHSMQRRYISSIEEVDRQETACIELASPDHLYVTENHIVTHNTTTTTPGQYYFAQYEPNNQMSLYTLAGGVVLATPIKGVIIRAAQILLDSPNRFISGFTYRTPDQTNEWLLDLRLHLNNAEACAEADYWPMNDTACDKFGGCKFRGICSKDPAVRDKFLAADFTKQSEEERWNPLRSR